jgi:hypothetical protein
MLYHLYREGKKFVIRCKIPVSESYRPSATSVPYHKLNVEATNAVASLVSDANGNDPDLTKHPWALHSLWRLPASQDVAVILEWQPATAIPQTATAGDVTPVASSSTTSLTPLRSSGVEEADDTASIMYVIPFVHTRG